MIQAPPQVITTLLAKRPRYSPKSSYFMSAYSKECQCLEAHYHLVQSVIDHQIMEERTSNQQLSDIQMQREEHGVVGSAFGLPPPLVPQLLVSLSGDKRLLLHTYLLEFCNSLCVVASLPTAIDWALSEVVSLYIVTVVWGTPCNWCIEIIFSLPPTVSIMQNILFTELAYAGAYRLSPLLILFLLLPPPLHPSYPTPRPTHKVSRNPWMSSPCTTSCCKLWQGSGNREPRWGAHTHWTYRNT